MELSHRHGCWLAAASVQRFPSNYTAETTTTTTHPPSMSIGATSGNCIKDSGMYVLTGVRESLSQLLNSYVEGEVCLYILTCPSG